MTKTYTKRADRREYRAEVFDGRGIAYVWIVDGYGRPVTKSITVVGVHTEAEAIDAAKAEGLKV